MNAALEKILNDFPGAFPETTFAGTSEEFMQDFLKEFFQMVGFLNKILCGTSGGDSEAISEENF